MKNTSILFVCLGNICRSPMAEEIMRTLIEKKGLSKNITVDSAGIISMHQGELPDYRMRQHATQRGYNLTHHSRPVNSNDFEKFDIILGMDDYNMEALEQKAPSIEAKKKVKRITDFCTKHTLDHVPDPYYGGADGFNLVIDLLEDACEGLLTEIIK